jgi:ankyrin repeat protein
MKLYCDDDFVGDTPLTYAVRSKKNVDAVRYLLDHDADPNKHVHHGCTPLSIAVGKGTAYEAYTSHCSHVLYLVCHYLIVNNFVLID